MRRKQVSRWSQSWLQSVAALLGRGRCRIMARGSSLETSIPVFLSRCRVTISNAIKQNTHTHTHTTMQHFVKDMSIALEEAQRMKLALPGLALAQQLYTALLAQGHHSPSLSRNVQRNRV